MKKISLLLCTLLIVLSTYAPVFAQSASPSDLEYLRDNRIIDANESLVEGELISREKFAKWVLRNIGFADDKYTPKSGKKPFRDVSIKKNPYAPYIYRLKDLGAFEAENYKPRIFKPKEEITLKEAIEWLFFVHGIPVPKVIHEKDFLATNIKPTSRVAPLIDKAIKVGVLKPGSVDLYKKLTADEAASLLKTVRGTIPTLTVTILPTVESDLTSNPKFDILLSVWNRVGQTYLKRNALNNEELVYGAIEGMVKELKDKHSEFMRPGDDDLIDSLHGEIEGIGAVIQLEEAEVRIVSPIIGSPAEKAGLLSNDIILEVDDVSVKGMQLSAVANRIKGKRGTQVKLMLKRNSKTFTVTITRDIVKVISAKVEFTEDNIAKITLSNFGERTIAEFREIIAQIQEKKPRGLVLDLRNNPGGFLTTAVAIAGFFIESDRDIAIVKYPAYEEHQPSAGNAELASYRTIILVNTGSASASEIIAGALQDYGIAKVIGEKTYGKGSVQELSTFSDRSQLKLTVAEWLTPLRRSIEKDGIGPNIEVKLTEEDRKAGRDPQMQRALEEIRK